MDSITIQEVVNFHIKQGKNADEILKNVLENVEELAKKEVAKKLGATCIYSCFYSDCNFCGQCIGEEFENFQEIIEHGQEHEYRMERYSLEQIERHGHPI